MPSHALAADRLQPSLLDRLTDEAPQASLEAEDRRVLSKAALRQAVLRDLAWLFNATQPLSAQQVRAHPLAGASSLNFGLPPLSGQLASKVDVSVLEKAIARAIVHYEPRVLADSLSVKAIELDDVLSSHNVIEFEIRGLLWAQPVPLELLLRTQLDLEAGQTLVRDMNAPVMPRLAAGLLGDAPMAGSSGASTNALTGA